MDQQRVWDSIADKWSRYRTHPREEAAEFLKGKKGMILDIGCGSGRNFAKSKGTIVGVDFSERMLRHARKKAKNDKIDALLVKADAAALPFRENSFDAILCANTLPSIKYNKHRKVLSELSRTGKKRSEILVSVWNKKQPRFERSKKETFIEWKIKNKTYRRYYYLYDKDGLKSAMKKFFRNVRVFGSSDKAFKRFPKNIIAIARVAR